jgi:hypothetical protein
MVTIIELGASSLLGRLNNNCNRGLKAAPAEKL